MFSFNRESRGGKGYIILNVIRVLNIIALLTVVAASWVMLVMTVKTSSFFFFDGVSHFITNAIGLFLVVSELNLFKSYFTKYWPLLSYESGFVPLGLSMIILGFHILGNLNKEATSQENLGLPLWRVVIASGCLVSIMGFTNIVATYVFCDSKLGITGRQVRSHGATTTKEHSTKSLSYSVSSGSMRLPPSPILPSYQNSSPDDRRKSRFGLKFPIRLSGISRPIAQDSDRSSPVVPDVQRPPTALHPAYSARDVAPHYPASSRYSVATNDNRF